MLSYSSQEALASRQSTSEAVLAHLLREEAAAAERLEKQRLELEVRNGITAKRCSGVAV